MNVFTSLQETITPERVSLITLEMQRVKFSRSVHRSIFHKKNLSANQSKIGFLPAADEITEMSSEINWVLKKFKVDSCEPLSRKQAAILSVGALEAD